MQTVGLVGEQVVPTPGPPGLTAPLELPPPKGLPPELPTVPQQIQSVVSQVVPWGHTPPSLQVPSATWPEEPPEAPMLPLDPDQKKGKPLEEPAPVPDAPPP